jgi:ADP-ribose pyrophosphatase YjhB (NUDIX family)
MVRGWGINVWSIPKGKINENEVLMNCAIREVEEETGYTRPTHNHAHAHVHILAVLGRTRLLPSPVGLVLN